MRLIAGVAGGARRADGGVENLGQFVKNLEVVGGLQGPPAGDDDVGLGDVLDAGSCRNDFLDRKPLVGGTEGDGDRLHVGGGARIAARRRSRRWCGRWRSEVSFR